MRFDFFLFALGNMLNLSPYTDFRMIDDDIEFEYHDDDRLLGDMDSILRDFSVAGYKLLQNLKQPK